MAIKILLADDHSLVREGFKALLVAQEDMEVVAEAADGLSAVRQALKNRPDVVIMDLTMPELNGIEATREILAALPETRVIGLSIHAESRYIAEMLKAGASAYLLKESSSTELIRAIRTVVDGHTYLSPPVADKVVQAFVRTDLPALERSVFVRLTRRERQVLQLLAEGHTTKEIAHVLNLSRQTVHSHRQKIMTKLDIHSVAELVKYAVSEGVTDLF